MATDLHTANEGAICGCSAPNPPSQAQDISDSLLQLAPYYRRRLSVLDPKVSTGRSFPARRGGRLRLLSPLVPSLSPRPDLSPGPVSEMASCGASPPSPATCCLCQTCAAPVPTVRGPCPQSLVKMAPPRHRSALIPRQTRHRCLDRRPAPAYELLFSRWRPTPPSPSPRH